MKKTERLLKSLANRRRLAILKFLQKTKEANVSQIAGAIHLSFKATSKHLAILASTDIVEKEQRGLEMYYHLTKEQPSVVMGVLIHISNSRE